mmetsp:Transcript_40066/g.62977  ORF Transcript_40066/g.62977 Transcript_40066/m.62977 type:complete len:380 (+) Transcript_40066:184-1323(+)
MMGRDIPPLSQLASIAARTFWRNFSGSFSSPSAVGDFGAGCSGCAGAVIAGAAGPPGSWDFLSCKVTRPCSRTPLAKDCSTFALMFSRKASTSCAGACSACTACTGTAVTGSRGAGMSSRTCSNLPLLAASRRPFFTFALFSDFSDFTAAASGAAPDAAVFSEDISFKTSVSLPLSLASISTPRSSDRTCASSAEGAAGGISLTICESTSFTLPISLASARTSFSCIFTFITSVSSACNWDSAAIASRTSAIFPESLASSRASRSWTLSSSASLHSLEVPVVAGAMPRWAAISSRICFIFPDSLASNNASRNSPCTFWVRCSPEISSSTVFIVPLSLAPCRTCRISVFSRRMSSNSFWFMAILRAASRSPDSAACSSRP